MKECMKTTLKENLKKIKNYIVGWTRYKIYYSKELYNISLSRFIRQHIREQFEARINSMHLTCYVEGQCIKCGCATTALQMANESCKGFCYPRFLSKKEWESLKTGGTVVDNEIVWYLLPLNEDNNYEFCKK